MLTRFAVCPSAMRAAVAVVDRHVFVSVFRCFFFLWCHLAKTVMIGRARWRPQNIGKHTEERRERERESRKNNTSILGWLNQQTRKANRSQPQKPHCAGFVCCSMKCAHCIFYYAAAAAAAVLLLLLRHFVCDKTRARDFCNANRRRRRRRRMTKSRATSNQPERKAKPCPLFIALSAFICTRQSTWVARKVETTSARNVGKWIWYEKWAREKKHEKENITSELKTQISRDPSSPFHTNIFMLASAVVFIVCILDGYYYNNSARLGGGTGIANVRCDTRATRRRVLLFNDGKGVVNCNGKTRAKLAGLRLGWRCIIHRRHLSHSKRCVHL